MKANHRQRVQRQRSLHGVERVPMVGCFPPSVERRIVRDMARFNVSRSFAIVVAVAGYYGVAVDKWAGWVEP